MLALLAGSCAGDGACAGANAGTCVSHIVNAGAYACNGDGISVGACDGDVCWRRVLPLLLMQELALVLVLALVLTPQRLAQMPGCVSAGCCGGEGCEQKKFHSRIISKIYIFVNSTQQRME